MERQDRLRSSENAAGSANELSEGRICLRGKKRHAGARQPDGTGRQLAQEVRFGAVPPDLGKMLPGPSKRIGIAPNASAGGQGLQT